MKILKEYTEPTTIIITGQWVEPYKESIMLTDDECYVDVRDFKGDEITLSTFGFVTILTEDEFIDFINSEHFKLNCENEFCDLENMYIPIKDYVGRIGATGIIAGTKDMEFDNWDIEDYFYHQVDDSSPIIDISGEYKFKSMTIDQVIKFLSSDASSLVLSSTTFEKEVDRSIEEKIKQLEERIEAQSKQIALLNDTVDWCQRYVKNIAG